MAIPIQRRAPELPRREKARNLFERAKTAGKTLASVFKAKSAPVSSNLADHAYTLLGFGFISASSFVHSVFSGLLMTGILFLIFEFKVSE